MAEETENTNDGTWSGLKKTIVGLLGTVVTAGGVWLTTLLGGGDKAEPAPAQGQPVINVNMTNNQQQAAGGKTVIVKEGAAKPAEPAKPVKKKEGDEFKEKPAQW